MVGKWLLMIHSIHNWAGLFFKSLHRCLFKKIFLIALLVMIKQNKIKMQKQSNISLILNWSHILLSIQ